MIGKGLLALTILSSCVLSLPLTPSQMENEDVKVMKCIVEALADVLSRPRPLPVSQECLDTLKTDDRLVSILRHHNFLKELQEIAIQGGQERAQPPGEAATSDPTTLTPPTATDDPDRSMLEALGAPGERSILSQKKTTGKGEAEEEKDEGESREGKDLAEELQVKREDKERSGGHGSESEDEWNESRAEKREEEEEEEDEYEEKRGNSEQTSEEKMIKDKKSVGSGEKRHAPRSKSKEKKFDEEEEEEEEKDKRSMLFSDKRSEEEEEEEVKRESKESPKRWTKRGKAMSLKKKAAGKEARQEVPHHSKEVVEEEEGQKKRDVQRSPEEKELQMIARRGPEERRAGSEEEGSASRKSEEPEIESLAAIESELENVAQKLHELRRG